MRGVSELTSVHRSFTAPLDTNKSGRNDSSAPTSDEYIVDRLLRYVGFTQGRRSVAALTYKKMEAAATKSARLTTTEIEQVKVLYNLDVKLWHVRTKKIKGMKRQLDAILQQDQDTHVALTVQPAVIHRGNGGSMWVLQST